MRICIPGKLYRIPITDFTNSISNITIMHFNINKKDTTPTIANTKCLSSNIVMSLGNINRYNVFSQGKLIFIFYHSYVLYTLQPII